MKLRRVRSRRPLGRVNGRSFPSLTSWPGELLERILWVEWSLTTTTNDSFSDIQIKLTDIGKE